MAAIAVSPRYPTNQLIQPAPVRIMPTWPYTCWPGRRAAWAAPERTAPRINPCSAFVMPGSSGVPAPGALTGVLMTCGTCQLPASTAAATMAMDSRLIRTLPWPMVCAARVASSPEADGTEPEKAGTGSCDQSAPMPNSLTTWSHWLAESRSDRPANAVLQPSANTELNDFC